MSILIRGMDMPKNCRECFLFKSNMSGYWFCEAKMVAFGKEDVERLPFATPDWCPLVEIKTPHGRLINEKDLFVQHPGKTTHHHEYGFDWEIINAKEWLEKYIPTIIEAEE